MRLAALFFLLNGLAVTGQAQFLEPVPDETRYEAPSGSFSCEPPQGWDVVELDEPLGPVSRFVGPDDPAGVYPAGLTVRWHEPAAQGFVPPKKALENLRRKDSSTDRSSGPVRVLRIGGASYRTFEITEERLLPVDKLPSTAHKLHHFVALVPWGQGYFVIRLSSTLDTYLEHRETFQRFLRKFRPR